MREDRGLQGIQHRTPVCGTVLHSALPETGVNIRPRNFKGRWTPNGFILVLNVSSDNLCRFIAATKQDHNFEKTGVKSSFGPSLPTSLKCYILSPTQMVFCSTQPRDTSHEVCVDLWSSVWAVAEVDGHAWERVQLLGYFSIIPRCVDAWNSSWEAGDDHGCARGRVQLLGHLQQNATVWGAFQWQLHSL